MLEFLIELGFGFLLGLIIGVVLGYYGGLLMLGGKDE